MPWSVVAGPPLAAVAVPVDRSFRLSNLLQRHRIPPAPRRAGLTGRRFLQAHGRAILACDYFTVDTVFLKLASRRILFTACSEHVGGASATQQERNLAWQLQEARSSLVS